MVNESNVNNLHNKTSMGLHRTSASFEFVANLERVSAFLSWTIASFNEEV